MKSYIPVQNCPLLRPHKDLIAVSIAVLLFKVKLCMYENMYSMGVCNILYLSTDMTNKPLSDCVEYLLHLFNFAMIYYIA